MKIDINKLMSEQDARNLMLFFNNMAGFMEIPEVKEAIERVEKQSNAAIKTKELLEKSIKENGLDIDSEDAMNIPITKVEISDDGSEEHSNTVPVSKALQLAEKMQKALEFIEAFKALSSDEKSEDGTYSIIFKLKAVVND